MCKRSDTVENALKAMCEDQAYVLSLRNKNVVLNALARRLRISDPTDMELGYRDFIERKGLAAKHYPSIDGMRNIQRLMKVHNPQIEKLNLENLIDSRIMTKLDESGFIDRLFSFYGGK